MELKETLRHLSATQAPKEIESLLQQTTIALLSHYKVSTHGLSLYPIELESYFFKQAIYEDPYVHSNALQMNHFGELYVHRRGKEADSPYKMDNRVCVGISLSTDNTYYYSALIRSAAFSDGTMVFGPNNVLMHLMRRVNAQEQLLAPSFFDTRHAGTFLLGGLFHTIEGRKVLQPATAAEDPRDKTCIFCSSRVGLGDENPSFRDAHLRTVIGKLSKEYAFKEKTLLLNNYLQTHHLTREEAQKEMKRLRA